MVHFFDITKFNLYKEDNRREVKKANGGLPSSLWETYSAFANCYGGVIILGVAENKDGTWRTTGLKSTDRDKLLKHFWDTINNRKKVNVNLLSDQDVEIYEKDEDTIIVIYVPMANREQKPVYINDDIFGGTFRRNHEGDYHCTKLQVKAMLRDQTDNTMDMDVLDDVPISDLNYETIQGYRNRHRALKPAHPFGRLNDSEYLRSIGAAAISNIDKCLHPTAAGMLMFGDEYNIVRHFPEYFLDYREILDPTLALENVNLDVAKGEFVSIMGPSGCGKSTLLNIMGLLDAPSSGKIEINGTSVESMKDKELAAFRNKTLGFVFQSFHLINSLNVIDNVELPLLYRKMAAKERTRLAKEVLERVGLSHRMRHMPTQLSGGQCQRVAIARAIVGNPEIILADEPTGNLDSKMGAEVMELLHKLNKEDGRTIVMVTHNEEQAKQTSRTIRFFDGRQVQ